MSGLIHVLNAGSSSLKFAVFGLRADGQLGDRICRGQVDNIGGPARFLIQDDRSAPGEGERIPAPDHAAALQAVMRTLEHRVSGGRLAAAGHRVVHGGRRYTGPVLVDAGVLLELEALVPLAPSTSHTTSPPSGRSRRFMPSCRRWRASIRRFTSPSPRSPSGSPCRAG